jgi:hypothetical protein
VKEIQSVGISQYTIFSEQRHSSTKYSVSRDIPVQNTRCPVSRGIPASKNFRGRRERNRNKSQEGLGMEWCVRDGGV